MRTTPHAVAALTVVGLLLVSSEESGAQMCDAMFIEALRTRYFRVQSAILADALYEASCTKNECQRSGSLTVSVPDIADLKAAAEGRSVTHACLERNRSYFGQFTGASAFSFLPPDLVGPIDKCIGGLMFSAKVLGNNVSFRASSSDPFGTDAAVIERFYSEPPGSIRCQYPYKKDDKLTPAHTAVTCARDPTQDITVTLTTQKGGKELHIPHAPKIEERLYKWGHISSAEFSINSNLYKCVDRVTAEMFGEVRDCATESVCGNGVAIAGGCLIAHGRSVITVDGKPYAQRDLWRASEVGQNMNQCVLNGVEKGKPFVCVTDRTCGNRNAIDAMCAGRFGVQYYPPGRPCRSEIEDMNFSLC